MKNTQAVALQEATSDKDAEEVRIRQTEVLEREKDVVLAQLESLEKRESLELTSPIDGVIETLFRSTIP